MNNGNSDVIKIDLFQFAELPEIWANTKRKAMEVRQSIGPIQSYQVNLIEKRISLFEMRARIFRGKFVESKVSN